MATNYWPVIYNCFHRQFPGRKQGAPALERDSRGGFPQANGVLFRPLYQGEVLHYRKRLIKTVQQGTPLLVLG